MSTTPEPLDLDAAAHAEVLAITAQITSHTVGCICVRCEDLAAAAAAMIAEGDRRRTELRDARNDLLDVRGLLSPNGGDSVLPAGYDISEQVAPAVEWLIDEVRRLRAEAANYFVWRQRDAVRNSISMAAQAVFSAKQLHGVNSDGMQEMLWSQHGINWNDYPDDCKRGWIITRAVREAPISYVDKRTSETVDTIAERTFWDVSAAPHLSVEAFVDLVPPDPTVGG